MKELIGMFVVSFIASLCADFVALAFVAWATDEIAHLERKLND